MCHYNDGYYIIYKYLVWKRYDNTMYVVRANFITVLLENTARKHKNFCLLFFVDIGGALAILRHTVLQPMPTLNLCSWDWLRILVPKVLKFLAGTTISRFQLTIVTDTSLCWLGCILKYFYYFHILQIWGLCLCLCLHHLYTVSREARRENWTP